MKIITGGGPGPYAPPSKNEEKDVKPQYDEDFIGWLLERESDGNNDAGG